MRRLYVQIYAAFVASLLLLGFVFSVTWLWLTPSDGSGLDAVAAMAEKHLPAAGAPAEEVDAALRDLAGEFHLSLALWDAEGMRLGAAGAGPVPRPESSWASSRFLRSRGRGITWPCGFRMEGGSWHGIGKVPMRSRC
jgi:hypothetical protein